MMLEKQPEPGSKSETGEGKEGFLRGIIAKISGKRREVQDKGEKIIAETANDQTLDSTDKQAIQEAVAKAHEETQRVQGEALAEINKIDEETKVAQGQGRTIEAAGLQQEKEYQQRKIAIAQAEEKLAGLKPKSRKAGKTEKQIRQKQAEQDIAKLRKEIAGLKQGAPELTQKRQELQTAKITAEKEKTIGQKAFELFTNKEVAKRFVSGQVNALASILGVRTVYSLPTWIWEKSSVRGGWLASTFKGRKGLEKQVEKVLETSQRIKVSKKGETSFADLIELRGQRGKERAEMMKIVKMTKEGGQKNSALRKELARAIRQHRAENSNLNGQEAAEIKKIIDKHGETKINGLEVARDGLNSACVAAGAFHLRIFTRGLFDAVGRYQRLQREAKPGQDVSFWRDAVAKGVAETFQKAAFAFGEGKTAKQRGLEFAQAASALMSYYGMGALSLLRPEVITADIDNIINTFGGGQDLGQMMENMGQNFFENAEIVGQRYGIGRKEHLPEQQPLGRFKHPQYRPNDSEPIPQEPKPGPEMPQAKPSASAAPEYQKPATVIIPPHPKPAATEILHPRPTTVQPAAEASSVAAPVFPTGQELPPQRETRPSFAKQFPSEQDLKKSMLGDLHKGLAKEEPNELEKKMAQAFRQGMGKETPTETPMPVPAPAPKTELPPPPPLAELEKQPLAPTEHLPEVPIKPPDLTPRPIPIIEKREMSHYDLTGPELASQSPADESLNNDILETYGILSKKISDDLTGGGNTLFLARLHDGKDIEFRHATDHNEVFYRLKGQEQWQSVNDLSREAQAPYLPSPTKEPMKTPVLSDLTHRPAIEKKPVLSDLTGHPATERRPVLGLDGKPATEKSEVVSDLTHQPMIETSPSAAKLKEIFTDPDLRQKINELPAAKDNKYSTFATDQIYFRRNASGQLEYSSQRDQGYAPLPQELQPSPAPAAGTPETNISSEEAQALAEDKQHLGSSYSETPPKAELPKPEPVQTQPLAETAATSVSTTEFEVPKITEDTPDEIIKYLQENDRQSLLLPVLTKNQEIGNLYQEVTTSIDSGDKAAAQNALDSLRLLKANENGDDYNFTATENVLIKNFGFNPKDLEKLTADDEKTLKAVWEDFLKKPLPAPYTKEYAQKFREEAGVLLNQLRDLKTIKNFVESF